MQHSLKQKPGSIGLRRERTAVRPFTSFRPKPAHATDAPSTSGEAPSTAQPGKPAPLINVIPFNGKHAGRTIDGIPPVMGAHLLASGAVAPMSVSKGPGLDVTPHPFQYPSVEGDASIVLFFSKKGVAKGVVKAVCDAAEAAIASKGSFTLVLSGGSLLGLLSGLVGLKGPAWDQWHIFYVDERNVPHDSADSNHKGALHAFLSQVAIPAANIHAILEGVPVEQAATHYEAQLIGLPAAVLPRNQAGLPVFDLMLLGMGPDGHVASLFPNRAQTAATKGWVLPVTSSPKPPPERITMSMPVINAAKEIVLVAMGEEKAEVVQRVLEVQALPGSLPAQMVRPTSGTLRWFLDLQSASQLDAEAWDDKKAFPRSQ